MSPAADTGPGSKRAPGFLLVEAVAAVLVGLFLALGIVQLASTSGTDSRCDSAQMQRRADGRAALAAIARDVRMAGYAGCARLAHLIINPVGRAGPAAGFSTAQPLGGEDQAPARHPLGALAGTDLLSARRLSMQGATLRSDMATPAGAIPINALPEGLDTDGLLAIADCDSVDLFTAAVGDANTLLPASPLSKAYRAGSRVMALRESTFFIGRNAAGRPTLRRAGHRPAELLEGVADMQIRYGEDTDGDGSPDLYRDASAVDAWSQVRSLRIGLMLLDGEDGPADRSRAATGLGETREGHPPAQAVTTTIALRNRLP